MFSRYSSCFAPPSKRRSLHHGVWAFCVLLLLNACTKKENTLPYYNDPTFTPLWEGESSFSADTLHTIASFAFIDQNGHTITNENFTGKVYVANFFFTICPGICPRMTANLASVADKFKGHPDVAFISHSVTPDIDSVAQLKKFADENHINHAQWHLVTGDKEKIYSLARQSYFAEQEIGFQFSTQKFLHTENLILVDTRGHIRGLYKGTLKTETERLAEDIAALLSEQK